MMEQETNLTNETTGAAVPVSTDDTQTSEIRKDEPTETTVETEAPATEAPAEEVCNLISEDAVNEEETPADDKVKPDDEAETQPIEETEEEPQHTEAPTVEVEEPQSTDTPTEEADEPQPAEEPTAEAEEPQPTDTPTEEADEPQPAEEPTVEADEPQPTEEPTVKAEEPELTEALMKELPSTPDNYCGDLQEAIEVGAIGMIDKQEILNKLEELNRDVAKVTLQQVDKLKQAYYRIVDSENEELKKIYVANGGDEADFKAPDDETAGQLKQMLAEFKQKKAALREQDEKRKEDNYVRKLQLIDRLQALIDSQDDFNKRYNEFKEIQQKWKEYDPIPQEHVRELWRKYQLQNERFYDLVKINNEFRDYDFKKNLELKTTLCDTADKLAADPDAISAYHQMQKLFQQWREIGPVSRDHREALWARFKEASTVINRRYQSHFEVMKANEGENLLKKQAICEKLENINYDALKSFRDWEKKANEVTELQKEWRKIGFATKRQNSKVFDRFRKAGNAFFEKRSAFFKTAKKEFDNNLRAKRDIVAQAEALKTSTDWKETTKRITELQAEWRKIGPVTRKQSESVWKQFSAACDYFFEQKSNALSSSKSEESKNLDTKRQIIKKINALSDSANDQDGLATLRQLIAEWGTIGHVPFREKDKLYKTFSEAVNKQYDRMNIAQIDRRMQQFRSEIADSKDRGRLHSERDKLMRAYDRIKGELHTYENNLGFFTISSKGGNSLLKEMQNRIERLKDEMSLIEKKISAIDENLDA